MGSSTGVSPNGDEAGKAREVTVRWMGGADKLLSLSWGPIRDQNPPLDRRPQAILRRSLDNETKIRMDST